MQSKTPLIVTLLLVLFLVSTFETNAQCSGIYFKPSKIQKIPASRLVLDDDLNNDGKKDLVSFAVNPSNLSSSTINVQLKVTGGFQDNPTSTQFNAFSQYFDAKIGDVNGDGLKDIVMIFDTAPRSVVTYINNGSSGFTASQPTALGSSYELLNSVIDLNGDGKADLLTISVAYTLSYRLAQADNTFGSPVQILTNVRSAFAGKFSSDNNNDIVVYILDTSTNEYKVLPLINQGNAVFSINLANRIVGFEPYAVGDLNNDGILDLTSVIDRNSQNTSIFEYQIYTPSNQGVMTKSTKVVNNFYGAPLVGDFNGDGIKDIAFSQGSTVTFQINNGNGSSFSESTKARAIGPLYVTDFNGDGKDDVFGFLGTNLFGNNTYNIRSVQIYENTCNQFGQTKVLDFNNDGYSDIAFWRPTDGRWLINSHASNFLQTFYWGISTNDVPVPNDYDGDGRTDLAIYRKSEGAWYVLRSSDNAWMVFQFGFSDDKPIPSDFDNDGKADIAVYRPSNGGWYVMKSQTNSFFGLQFGIAEDKPLPMDFDGDGKSDFAVYRPSTGVWYVLKSSDYNTFAVPFGISTDTPIPADYDLDGKADIAVFRDGVWYILLSGDNSVLYYQWGTTGDIPFVYGSYPSNIAVYRPSQTKLYFTPSLEPLVVPNVNANDNFISILPR